MSTLSSLPSLHRIYIIGGAQLYSSSLTSSSSSEQSVADRILLTRITKGDEAWECDTFFPELSKEDFEAVEEVASGRHTRFVNMKDVFGFDVWPEESNGELKA